MKNSEQPAFPALDSNRHQDGTTQLELRYEGLTKREYFAAKAPEIVPEWFQNNEYTPSITDPDRYFKQKKRYFNWREYYADEMLKQLEGGNNG